MSHLPELEMLVDAFPNYPRSELASRLLCSASAEVLFNELLAEAGSTKPATSGKIFASEVDRLKDLFPTARKDELAAALHRNNGDLDKTIDQMLESGPVQKLAQITGLSEPELGLYVARNNNDVLRALADVVAHHKKRKKVRASRVQAPGTTTASYQDAYVLRETTPEVLQLKECVWAESALREINYDFLLKLLVFFQGDVARVLDVTRLYIEAGCQGITHDLRLGFQHKEVPANTLPASSVIRLGLPLLISPQPIRPRLGQLPINSRTSSPANVHLPKYNPLVREKSPLTVGAKAMSRLQTPIHLVQPNQQRNISTKPGSYPGTSAGRLDLHGFTVSDATKMVKDAVTTWWAEEKEGRACEGHVDRYGSRAEFVEPLQIITGRGIHSAGGAPKIRLAVVRLLSHEGYLIDENVGSVAVYGKKLKM